LNNHRLCNTSSSAGVWKAAKKVEKKDMSSRLRLLGHNIDAVAGEE
jgi:hypothetical protein